MVYGVSISLSAVGSIGVDYLNLASITSIRILIIVKSSLIALISSIIVTIYIKSTKIIVLSAKY